MRKTAFADILILFAHRSREAVVLKIWLPSSMDVFLSKLVPLAVYPLGASILLVLAAVAVLVAGYRRVAMAVIVCAIAGLWILSTPSFASLVVAMLEQQHRTTSIDTLEPADVVVVLGGVLGPPQVPGGTADLSDAIDRVFAAARIYRAGKAQYVLVSGGNLPWKSNSVPEAVLIADILGELGVPIDAIVIEPASRNTFENATNTALILKERGWTKIILVTSGTHMPRALATFRRAGVEAVPVATDIKWRGVAFETALDFLPDAGALARTTECIKEFIGLIVYRIRGQA